MRNYEKCVFFPSFLPSLCILEFLYFINQILIIKLISCGTKLKSLNFIREPEMLTGIYFLDFVSSPNIKLIEKTIKGGGEFFLSFENLNVCNKYYFIMRKNT